MILAAGQGTRLRPHTLRRPKPLFPVLDRPLLGWIIEALQRAGCRRIVVNAFHLREQIAARLAGEPGLEIQLEETELGTGGGLRLARPRFDDQPVLVVNGDIFHNIDYRRVMEHHRREGNDATLVLHDRPPYNKVWVDGENNILSFTGGQPPLLAFTGIQVFEPARLELIPAQGFYHSIDWYRQLIQDGHRVRGLTVRNHFWSDMGTPEDYLDLHEKLLTTPGRERLTGVTQPASPGKANPDASRPDQAGSRSPFWLGADVRRGRGVRFADWVAVGSQAVLGEGVQLRRCVVWDGVRVPAGTTAEDRIFSGGD